MTARVADTGETVFIDFREVAPSKAVPEMWQLDENGKVKNKEKQQGGKSICIPGEVAGLCHILEKYGTMSLREVLEPSIRLAEEGFIVSALLKRDIDDKKEKFLNFEEEGNIYIKDYEIGDRITNHPLANTLKVIAEKGKDGFYKGKIAEQMVQSINTFGGNVSMQDFVNYKIQELEPLKGHYRGYEIISSPPPSSGGTHVIQILNMLENFSFDNLEFGSAEYIHLFSEIYKMVFADRAKYMGDPKFVELPLQGLISKNYAKKLAKKIEKGKVKAYSFGDPFSYEPCDTTHYSIIDKAGNMVSITKTISAFFGSGVVPTNTGIVLNCQMRGFSLGSGKPNSVSGGKKPLSSMSPTIILKDNKPFAVVGSPGANRIITSVAQVISNLIDYGMNVELAVNSPRIYNDTKNRLLYEARISDEEIDKIKALGQDVEDLKKWDRSIGGVQAVRILENGLIEGTADPRRDGIAIGY